MRNTISIGSNYILFRSFSVQSNLINVFPLWQTFITRTISVFWQFHTTQKQLILSIPFAINTICLQLLIAYTLYQAFICRQYVKTLFFEAIKMSLDQVKLKTLVLCLVSPHSKSTRKRLMRNWFIYSVDPVNERPTFASLEGFRSLKKKKHLLKGGLETAQYVNVQSFSGCLDH